MSQDFNINTVLGVLGSHPCSQMDQSDWLNDNWQYIICSFSIPHTPNAPLTHQMHVEWTEPFEY